MSHARLTFTSVATAFLFLTGCAGPAWLVHGEFPTAAQRHTIKEDETTTKEPEKTAHSHHADATSSDEDRSLAQVLDDLERIKDTRPSDFAVIQSAVEDTSRLFPPQYRQTFKDQMLGVALQRQGASPLEEQLATAVSQPGQVPKIHAPVVEASPRAAAAAYLPLPVSAPSRNTAAAAPSTVVTTQVSDLPPSEPTTAAQPRAAPQATSESAVAAEEVVAAEEIGAGQWNREIERALASLSADLDRPNLDRNEQARLEIMRRLLYVATNQRDEAVSPIKQLDEDEQEYWKHQIHALLVSIDADGKHPTTRRAALALRNLRTATEHLANVSTLDVRNLTFCKEVLSYGEYRVFDSYSFRAKDEVVMYVEIDNFAAHPRGDSFETELHSSYEIVDDAGRRVANVVLPVDKQVSTNRRRDYFIAYLITLPSQIAPGSYRLRLTVEDVIGKKSNHAAVDFRVQ